MNFFPKFEKGTILRREMLVALRDYPREFTQTLFNEYGNGILSGFATGITENNDIRISKGIAKINGSIYLMKDDFTLKSKVGRYNVFLTVEELDDGDYVQNKLKITDEAEDFYNFELFRYTRNADILEYAKFNDIGSDMANRLNKVACAYSCIGGSSLAPEYFVIFARELLEKNDITGFDYAFATQCLVSAISIELLNNYFVVDVKKISNHELLNLLKEKLISFSARSAQPIKEEKPQPPRQVTIY